MTIQENIAFWTEKAHQARLRGDDADEKFALKQVSIWTSRVGLFCGGALGAGAGTGSLQE